jgi:hypothetical protein
MEFNELVQTKKGGIGEEIILNWLDQNGYICYNPYNQNRPHWCDIVFFNKNYELFFADVKTKAKLNKYNATGINTNSYNNYKKIMNETNQKFFIFFVDENAKDIHLLDLSNCSNGFHLVQNDKIIYWKLEEMIKIADNLDLNICNQIKEYNTRSYPYL